MLQQVTYARQKHTSFYCYSFKIISSEELVIKLYLHNARTNVREHRKKERSPAKFSSWVAQWEYCFSIQITTQICWICGIIVHAACTLIRSVFHPRPWNKSREENPCFPVAGVGSTISLHANTECVPPTPMEQKSKEENACFHVAGVGFHNKHKHNGQRGLNTKRSTVVFFLSPTKPLPSYDQTRGLLRRCRLSQQPPGLII